MQLKNKTSVSPLNVLLISCWVVTLTSELIKFMPCSDTILETRKSPFLSFTYYHSPNELIASAKVGDITYAHISGKPHFGPRHRHSKR